MSTTYAPTTAYTSDPMREATARAAAKAGMTVEAWLKYTTSIEKGFKRLRSIDKQMRQVPRYRDEDAS